MNSKSKILFIVLLIVIASFFVAKKLFSNTDKQEINLVIDQLEESLEFEKKLQPLAVASRLNKVKSLLTTDFSAKYVGFTSVKSIDNPKSIKGRALIASRYFSQIDIFKLPFLIKINHNDASADFTATITGQDFKELFEIKAKFKKINNKWLVSSIIASRLTPEDGNL